MLIIGHHILYGKQQQLDKSLGVIVKKRDEEEGNTEYNVIAIIQRKLIFKVRPKPIVTYTRK